MGSSFSGRCFIKGNCRSIVFSNRDGGTNRITRTVGTRIRGLHGGNFSSRHFRTTHEDLCNGRVVSCGSVSNITGSVVTDYFNNFNTFSTLSICGGIGGDSVRGLLSRGLSRGCDTLSIIGSGRGWQDGL